MKPQVGCLAKLKRGPFEAFVGSYLANFLSDEQFKPKASILVASDHLYFQRLREVEVVTVIDIWGNEALIKHKSRRLQLPLSLLDIVSEPRWKTVLRALRLKVSI